VDQKFTLQSNFKLLIISFNKESWLRIEWNLEEHLVVHETVHWQIFVAHYPFYNGEV